jgi:hypothetical protein
MQLNRSGRKFKKDYAGRGHWQKKPIAGYDE